MNLTIEVDRLEVMNLQAGDVLVVTLPAMTTPEQFKQAEQKFNEAFPDNRVLVKTNNVGLDILAGIVG